MMSLKQRVVSDLTAAMKAQDAPRLSTLRMVKAALMNREIEQGGELPDEELTKLLQSLVKQRRDSVAQHEQGGRAVATGTPAEIMRVQESYTGRFLKAHLARLERARGMNCEVRIRSA